MQSDCDILILTARFGTGHVSVSNALKEHIHKRDTNIKIVVADLYEIMRPNAFARIYRNYEGMVRYAPKLYNTYYYGKEKFKLLQKIDTASHMNLKKLARYMDEKRPLVVISTFPLCTGYLSKYKKAYHKNIPLLTCITDVVDSKEWLHEGCDAYFVADGSVKASLIEKKIPQEIVHVTGIPIRSQFVLQQSMGDLRRRLGYLEQDQIILMMGGGLGIFPRGPAFYSWLSQQENYKVIVLAGKNRDLYDQLMALDAPNIQVLKHTDQVAEYMKIADVLVGKSGGITLYEAIASTLPLVIYRPLLGQEIKNCHFIKEKGIGFVAQNLEDLKEQLRKILGDKEVREEIGRSLKTLRQSIDMDLLGERIMKAYKEVKRQ